MNSLLIILTLMIIAVVLGLIHDRVPKPFRDRKCMGAAWKRAFPDADSAEIRKFLRGLTWAFDFKANHGLKFAPTDTFMEIYSGIYKHQWTPDNMEDVEFVLTLEDLFGKKFPDSLSERDATLGEIFDAMRPIANHKANRTSFVGPVA
jgi:hypothetical protein